MVTSSFEFFPGVPIFHSTDLIHWEQLGHVLDRPTQLNLDSCPDSRGIYAPTLRHHNGIFYMITTLVSETGDGFTHRNFVCTTADPAGAWSEPHWIADAPGIDPSLFFDPSGRAWYHGNCQPPKKNWPSHRQIWLQELDLNTFQLKGERKILLDAADSVDLHGQDFCNAIEAPHIYEKEGWFHLLVSGGGTGWGHSLYLFRSQTLDGPYAPCPANPIMTHRHLPKETAAIHCPGHGDFIQTQTGEWWIVFLATRPYAGYHNYLGRETMMAPVDWSGDWPVISPETGRIEREYSAPDLPHNPLPATPAGEEFDSEALSFSWNVIRTPREPWWNLNDRPGHLRLQVRPPMLHESKNPSFLGRRVQDLQFSASTVVEFNSPGEGDEAGLVLYKSSEAHFRLVLRTLHGQRSISVIKRLVQDDRDSELIRTACPEGPIRLRIDTRNRRYRFSFSTDGNSWQVLDNTFDVSCLAQVVVGGFTGIYIGPFAGSNGHPSTAEADFSQFNYHPQKEPS